MKSLSCIVMSVVAMAICVAPAAGQSGAPLGSAQFKASPEQPVGWRGDGTGQFPGAAPPISWERKRDGVGYATKGIVWAAMLPNRGISSPIVAGQRVFVTCEFSDIVCLDKLTGRILWIRSSLEFEAMGDEANPDYAQKLAPLAQQLAQANAEVVEALNALLPTAATTEYKAPAALVKKRAIEKQIRDQQQAIDKKKFAADWPQGIYGFCTETPASDGKYVCAFFGTGVAACYDMDGNRKWIAIGSRGGEEKGHYSSPLIADGKFIVWADPEIRAYDVPTGKVVWRTPAKGSNCGSVYRLQAGGETVVSPQASCFFRASDGKPIWGGKGLDYSFTTPVVAGGMIYTWTPGPKKDLKSLRIPADTGGGTVTPGITFQKADWADDELTGKFDKGDINASPLYVDGLIYNVYPGGGLLVHDAASGQIVYRKVLPGKPRVNYWDYGGSSASPALAGRHIVVMDNQGTSVVIEPGRVYKEVAVNRIEESVDGKSQSQNLASPVFEGSRMYYRTPGYVYCIGEK